MSDHHKIGLTFTFKWPDTIMTGYNSRSAFGIQIPSMSQLHYTHALMSDHLAKYLTNFYVCVKTLS